MDKVWMNCWGDEPVLGEFEEEARNYKQVQRQILECIMRDNADTEYGRKHNFHLVKTEADYRSIVPVTEFEAYDDYISRMVYDGEENLLTAYPIQYYMMSSGTTGTAKYIPMSEKSLIHFARYTHEFAYETINRYYEEELGAQNAIENGKVFMLNEVHYKQMENGKKSGIVSSSIFEWMKEQNVLNYDRYTSPKELLFPTEEMDTMFLKLLFALEYDNVIAMEGVYVNQLLNAMDYLEKNWKLFVDCIRDGIIPEQIIISQEQREMMQSYLKSNPIRAAYLQEEFEKGFETPILSRIWKNIRYVMAISGNAFSKYMSKLKRYIGDIPYHYFVYGASEGIFGPSLRMNQNDKYVFPARVAYFEFLPLENLSDSCVEDYITTDVEIGKKYELIYTGFSGLYRYRVGDIVEICDFYFDAPVISFCYRKKQMVNVAGEKMDMGSVASVIDEFEEEYQLDVNDFCVYMDEDEIPARYVILIELNRSMVPVLPEDIHRRIDQMFRRVNLDYDDCRKLKEIGMPKVVFLKQGTFEAYKEHLRNSGKEVGQHKPVRILDTEEKRSFFFERIMV